MIVLTSPCRSTWRTATGSWAIRRTCCEPPRQDRDMVHRDGCEPLRMGRVHRVRVPTSVDDQDRACSLVLAMPVLRDRDAGGSALVGGGAMTRRQPEAKLKSAIQRALRQMGCWEVRMSGSTYVRPGIPDLIVAVPQLDGSPARLLALEVKTDSGIVSASQLIEIRRLRACGAVAGVVRSVQNARHAVARLQEGAIAFFLSDA